MEQGFKCLRRGDVCDFWIVELYQSVGEITTQYGYFYFSYSSFLASGSSSKGCRITSA
jgi:hypothetical protein